MPGLATRLPAILDQAIYQQPRSDTSRDNPATWLNVQAWLAPDRETAYADQGSVQTPTEWSGVASASAITQATAGSRPLWTAGGLNGRPSFHFDGTAAHWRWDAIGATLSGNGTFTVFAVVAPGAITAASDVFGVGRSSTNTPTIQCAKQAAGTWTLSRTDDSNSSGTAAAMASSAAVQVVAWNLTTTEKSVWDRGRKLVATANANGTLTADRAGVGCLMRAAAGSFYKGEMGDWVLCSPAIPEAYIPRYSAWLVRKWSGTIR